MTAPYPPPYGFVWTGQGYRRLTPKQMIRRQIRQHNRRRAAKLSTKWQPDEPTTTQNDKEET